MAAIAESLSLVALFVFLSLCVYFSVKYRAKHSMREKWRRWEWEWNTYSLDQVIAEIEKLPGGREAMERARAEIHAKSGGWYSVGKPY